MSASYVDTGHASRVAFAQIQVIAQRHGAWVNGPKRPLGTYFARIHLDTDRPVMAISLTSEEESAP